MLLGDLIARFTDEAVAEESILAIGDLVLLAVMREKAATDGLDLGVYAATVVRRYALVASGEEWITLIGAMTRGEDPGAICLRRAFAYALRDMH